MKLQIYGLLLDILEGEALNKHRTNERFLIMIMKFDFGTEMSNGFNLFKEHMGLLVLASFVTSLLSVFTCAIIAGPMTVGLLMIIRRLLKKEESQPEVGDLFKGFSYFLNSFLVVLIFCVCSAVLSLVPVIGSLVAMLIGTMFYWVLMFVAYEDLSAVDAIKKVIDETTSGNFYNQLLFAFVASLISSAGVLLCFVGLLFTVPIAYCMMVCCYEATYGNKSSIPDPSIFLK